MNTTCTAADVQGASIYRGPVFYALFTEWKALSTKPLNLSEFGPDAFGSTSWWPVVGAEDQAAQATRVGGLWQDLAQELSAVDPSRVCLGGTAFQWNEEWWKTRAGSPSVHDPDGRGCRHAAGRRHGCRAAPRRQPLVHPASPPRGHRAVY